MPEISNWKNGKYHGKGKLNYGGKQGEYIGECKNGNCDGYVLDCFLDCGGDGEEDEEGNCCSPELISPIDGICCAGTLDCLGACDGSTVLDDCGVCGGVGVIDDCGYCDDNPDNDNTTCEGDSSTSK